jgi:uncharacterized protein YecE (DUF72 family)
MRTGARESSKEIYIGTSGWNYPHWQGCFYPGPIKKREWFGYYSSLFTTVEVNNTFYHLPEGSVFERWKKQAPAGFIYTLKANRYITHLKKLKEPEEPLGKFWCRATILGSHLGPLLYQLPPGWKYNRERLEFFLGHLQPELIHVLEFRDETWFQGEVRDLLKKYDVSFCVHDYYMVSCPDWNTGPVAYLRLHGPTGRYGGGYPAASLQRWARWVKSRSSGGKRVYVYFNNDQSGHAPQDARKLIKMLE